MHAETAVMPDHASFDEHLPYSAFSLERDRNAEDELSMRHGIENVVGEVFPELSAGVGRPDGVVDSFMESCLIITDMEVIRMPRSRTVKVIGTSGQITLGKQYAGKTILVEEVEKGVWLLKIARVIPEREAWLHTEPVKSRVDQAIAWAAEHPAQETDLEVLSAK